MTSTYLFPLSKIIYWNTFLKFLSFVHITSEGKYFTQLYWAAQKSSTVLYATSFYDSKIFIPNESAGSFGEDNFSLKKRLSFIKKLGF